MNVMVALSLITFALHFGATLTMLALARAPGWERLRLVALIAGTAGAYSVVNAIAMSMERTPEFVELTGEIGLVVAAAHVSVWLWYTFADATGRWSTVPRRIQALAVLNLVVSVAVSASGRMMTDAPMRIVDVPALGVRYGITHASAAASAAMALIIVALGLCLAEHVRRYRAGVPGMGAQVAGFTVFFLCAAEEAIVTIGVVDFIFLAELGFLAIVLPVAVQMIERLVGDARRLQVLTAALSDEVEVAHEERDAAREALIVQERFAAVGRMAGDVGHEINNPLQILSLSLGELRALPSVTTDAAAAEVVGYAVVATDRIRKIVAGLRTYALPGEPTLESLAPLEVVRGALAAARAALPELPDVHLDLAETPAVLGDRARLQQAIGHALSNAARAAAAMPAGTGRVGLRTRRTASGDVLIEVRDNGAGFPAVVLSRLGEPFVRTQPTGEGTGLGLFIIRGIVAAHGGLLELENSRGGGAVLRILLPPAATD
jgi:signal transduction histidine kinase